jgi:poly(beta-D-mannuronate) lyase
VWRNGDYADEVITINASGTEKNPVVVRAESNGGVRFSGLSRLRIKGQYVVVKGFWWQNPTLEKGVVVSFDKDCSYSLLEECAITGFDTELRPQCNVKWVSVWGYRNCVERCSLLDKRDIGQNLIVRLEKGERAPKAIIRNCHFSRPRSLLNEKGNRINGQCCIRIGTSNVTQQQAECVVENCYFDRCNGEGEIISNKSCGNIYRNNLFVECEGALTLRHGNNAQVLKNIFLGNGAKLSGGVRITGEGHLVKGNYFSGLTSRTYCAIHLMQGQEEPPLWGYMQVKRATICDNTFVDNYCCISVGGDRNKTCTLPVVETTIENNTITACSDCFSIVYSGANHDISWKGNTICGGSQKGISLPQTPSLPKLPNIERTARQIRDNAGVKFINCNKIKAK